MYKLDPTKTFEKGLKKLSHSEQQTVAVKLNVLIMDPYHPSLRTKKVKKLKDVFESSVNMDIRILWMHKGSKLILLIAIGHHDILP
jgi:mRNA-degrading endonuclease YafQ of YafQ-DinJ toxin-antitoxin module